MTFGIHTEGPESLLSVGIDVGTTTTQVIVSRLTVESGVGNNKRQVTDREVLYRSPVFETPLCDHKTIDITGVADIVQQCFNEAEITAATIDTGAVIVTGETARRTNATTLVEHVAKESGEFVAAAAGASLEAVLAGRGSGAAAHAAETDSTVVNVDIGGGTTNAAVFVGDRVVETRCCNIGGRLISFDTDGVVTAISPSIEPLLSEIGFEVRIGETLTENNKRQIADRMAACVVDLLVGPPYEPITESIAIGELPTASRSYDTVVFSGGIGALMGEYETQTHEKTVAYNDIGVELAAAIERHRTVHSWPVRSFGEHQHATVIGAGTATTQLTGRTQSITGQLLPIRDAPVVSVGAIDSIGTKKELTETLTAARDRGADLYEAMLQPDGEPGASNTPPLVLSIDSIGVLSYDRLNMIAASIAATYTEPTEPIVIALKDNCGKALGQTLQRVLPESQPVVVIDEVAVSDGDYIDIGEPIADDDTVVVAVKTLIFGE